MRKVRKLLSIICLVSVACILLAAAKSPVKHTAELYVNDYAGVLSAADKAEILAVARQLEQATGAQVAVLTVADLEGEDIAAFAYQTAESWGLGKKGEDNGVLIVLSVEDRLSRIEVGYGLEGTLTDIMTGRIQDNYMLPHYAQDDFSSGLREGHGAVASTVYQHYGLEAPDTLPQVNTAMQETGSGVVVVIGLVLLLILLRGRGGLLPFLLLSGGKGNAGRGAGGGKSFGSGGSFGGGGSSRRF